MVYVRMRINLFSSFKLENKLSYLFENFKPKTPDSQILYLKLQEVRIQDKYSHKYYDKSFPNIMDSVDFTQNTQIEILDLRNKSIQK